MRNKTLLCLLNVMGIMTVLALQPTVAAARQITLTVPDCPSGQDLTFSNSTLSCTGTVAPLLTPGSCAVTSTPTSSAASPLTPGTQVTLTAACATGAAATFTWNIGAIQSILIVAPSQTTTYTVTPSNASGPGSPFSATVYAGAAQIGTIPPTGCSITQSPNTSAAAVAAGTTVNLSASCSSGGAVASCSWNQGISSTSCSVSIQAPATSASYNVTASNAGGSATPVSTFVQVTGGNTSTGTGVSFCTSQDNLINVGWPASGQVRPTTNGFGNQRVAFRITIPANFNPSLNINHLGFMHIAEVPGSAVTSRDMTVSKNACDFQSGDYLYNAIGYGDTAPGANYTVNNPNGFLSAGGNFNLQSGDVVYVNIRNANGGSPSCPNSSCDVLFDFATPNRY